MHNLFHISILKIYIHDATHVIDWNIIQVEPEGEFHVGPERILDMREVTLELYHRTSQGAMEPP